MNYVRNAWYVVTWSRNVGRSLMPVTLLGEPVVLYRTEDGRVVALEDECPHRRLPLSKGRLKGDDVECGYHGMTFGCDGRCVRIPGQDNLPETARVHSYPVVERNGIVWLWPGEPSLADEARLFDLPQFSEPGWASHYGDALRIGANYMAVAENLCDPAHVSFVHPTTLGNADSTDIPVETERQGDVVVTNRWIRDSEPVGFFKAFGNFSGNVDRWHYYYYHAPQVAVIDFGSADAGLRLPPERRHEGVRLFALHFLTPISESETVDHWMHLRNIALEDDAIGDKMNDAFRIAFDEDKEVLEAIQAREARPRGRRPVRLAIDRGPLLLNQVVREMLAREDSAAA